MSVLTVAVCRQVTNGCSGTCCSPPLQDARAVLASLDTPSSQQDLALRERVLTQVGRPPSREEIVHTAVT